MSTTWKSLAAGFAAGVVSTGLYALGFTTPAWIVWALSVGYIVYQKLDA